MTTKLKHLDNFRNFDWDLGKIFYFCAKCNSLSDASKVLGVIQPTLTRQMQALERQLGFPLLIRRTAKGITLTRKGEEFLGILERIFVDMKAFTGKVEGNMHPRKIVIATSSALATYEIGDFILDYNDQHPHLNFDLIGKDQALDVILYDFDMAIRPWDADAKDVHQEPLFTVEKKLYASKGYLEKHGIPQTVEDLKDHGLIARPILHAEEDGFSDANWILKLGKQEGETPHTPCLGANSLEREISAAKKGKGIVTAYKELSIVRDSGLINILPDVGQETPYFFICPEYLKDDHEILGIKTCLKDRMSLFSQGMKQVA